MNDNHEIANLIKDLQVLSNPNNWDGLCFSKPYDLSGRKPHEICQIVFHAYVLALNTYLDKDKPK